MLPDASGHAGLVVAGTRGAGVRRRLAPGSTGTEVVHHAGVPVVVVPPEDGATPG
ncbi:universal stress protein [Kitasatospora griseola]|uniref:universal stress protein n=1 Tax=Kitasatospora griseola TaxID=2064 RepID=UPI003993DB6C